MSDVEVRAADAKALKENPLLAELLEKMKQHAVQAWLATPAVDGERARELAWVTYKAALRFEELVQGTIDDGIIAVARMTAPLR